MFRLSRRGERRKITRIDARPIVNRHSNVLYRLLSPRRRFASSASQDRKPESTPLNSARSRNDSYTFFISILGYFCWKKAMACFMAGSTIDR